MQKNILRTLQIKFMQFLVYATGRLALDQAPTIAIQQGVEAAYTFLRKKYRFYRPAAVRFWMHLYAYLMELESDLTVSTAPADFIVHFCCWGRSYTEKAERHLLASLNAENNLKSLAQTHKILLMIHCDLAAKDQLANSAVVKEMRKTMEVKFFVLPQALLNACHASYHYPDFSYFKRINRVNVNNKYFLLGGLQCHALKMALKHKAYISFMMPDFLLSDSFFKRAFSKISGKSIVLTTAFRTDYQKVKSVLTQMSTSISAEVLTTLQIEHMHAAAKRRVVSESTENFAPTPQLIFEHQNGFVIRAFHYHPVLIDCGQIQHEIKVDYMPIDYLLLNQILTKERAYEQQVWICDLSSEMAVMELSDAEVEKEFVTKPRQPLHQLVEQIRDMISNSPSVYDTPLNHFFSSVRHKIIVDKVYRTEVGIEDEAFFSMLTASTPSGHPHEDLL